MRNEKVLPLREGWTDNSWGPRAIGNYGAPVSFPTLKPHPKKSMKGQGHLMGPPTDPGPLGSARVLNGQSAPALR
ncbi:unnamed protein product [Staurois parvus]|uniref:Uncharacterized protein n=1 Tax=Staurois parvus TaxID=386267 RepID=A0ABN9CLG8_9NEOB|nr:unnamed protein product [Staurois parvus]